MRSLPMIVLTLAALACSSKDNDTAASAMNIDADADADADSDADADADADETGPIDNDGDGITNDEDCDDDDASLGAIASDQDCDGVLTDNDCDDGDAFLKASDLDPDCDGATTEEEEAAGTNPRNPDSDSDWVIDGQEIHGPRSPTEFEPISIALDADADTTRLRLAAVPNSRPMDIAFLVDTSCSSGGGEVLANLASEMTAMASSFAGRHPNVQYGFATFDDYAFGSFGSPAAGDRPFALHQRITPDAAAIATAAAASHIHFGADAPESTMEALYQGLTGAGYDQDCDGSFDADTDVLPFGASTADPFAGTGGSASASAGSGTGLSGGFGFRPYSEPVIVYFNGNHMRDPDAGYATPGGCPNDAGSTSVVAASAAVNATLIGFETGRGMVIDAMRDLAMRTGSVLETDDGSTPLVGNCFEFSCDRGAWYELVMPLIEAHLDQRRSAPSIAEPITDRYADFRDDTAGFVSTIRPSRWTEEWSGSIRTAIDLQPAVEPTDTEQSFDITLVFYANAEIELFSRTITVVVPAVD